MAAEGRELGLRRWLVLSLATAVLMGSVALALGQAQPPEEFIKGLPPGTAADWSAALAKEGYRLLTTDDYEGAKQYCEYAVRGHRLAFLAHWVLWRATVLVAEEGGEVDLAAKVAEMRKALKEQPEDPVFAFYGATADEHEGKLPAAKQAYGKLLDEFPGEAILHVRLGLVLSRMGNDEDAVAELEGAVAMDEGLVEAYEPLALGCLKLGHMDAAAEAAEKAIKATPERAQSYYVGGIAAFARGQRAEGIQRILEGTRAGADARGIPHWLLSAWGAGADWLAPFLLWAITTLVAVCCLWLAARERPGGAEAWLAGVNLLLVLAIFSPPAASRFGSIGPSGWTQAGIMYLAAAAIFAPAMVIEAIWSAIRGVLRTKEALISSIGWTTGVILFMDWLMSVRSEYRFSVAPIIVLPIVLSLVMGRGHLISTLALSFLRLPGRQQRAIAWHRAALRIDRSKGCRVLAHSALGDAHLKLGRFEEALREYEQSVAVGVRPTSGMAACGMVGLYVLMGRYQEAAAVHARAAELCGSLGFAALPGICQAELLMYQGHYEAAVAAARAALSKSLASGQIKAAANAVLGYGLAMVTDFQGATQACEKARKAKNLPTWASLAEVAMGIMWSSSGHWQEALQHFSQAVQLWEANIEAHLRAAQAYAMLGQWDKAEVSLKAARDRAPLSQFAPLAAQLLEQGPTAWQAAVLPMPRPPVYAEPQQYPPAGYPYGQPPRNW